MNQHEHSETAHGAPSVVLVTETETLSCLRKITSTRLARVIPVDSCALAGLATASAAKAAQANAIVLMWHRAGLPSSMSPRLPSATALTEAPRADHLTFPERAPCRFSTTERAKPKNRHKRDLRRASNAPGESWVSDAGGSLRMAHSMAVGERIGSDRASL